MSGRRGPREGRPDRRYVFLALGLGLAVIGSLVAAGVAGASAGVAVQDSNESVSEEAYVQPAPEPGDPYFEAAADDGSWISYENPRDEYRSPYLGDGSGKICVTLLNENGEPVVGKSVPNTSVTIPTGGATTWHSHADPMTVRFPMTEHYTRPLDADQFGTSPDIAQGDGYMDSHCIEFHGNPEDATLTYGKARISGEYADRIDVVGYVEQVPKGDGWDTGIDPVAAAEPYEETGGGWTYNGTENATHAQVDVILQLDAPAGERLDSSGSNETNSTVNESERSANATDQSDGNEDDGSAGDGDAGDGDAGDEMPGFGGFAALAALSVAVVARLRR